MESDENSGAKADRWRDDVLDRAKLAQFLTASLTQETIHLANKQSKGLTIALDAGWGAGKTFFVRRWADDLRESGYPVVLFDAWENDIGDEAAIALMAAIRGELNGWAKKLPKSKNLRLKAEESTRNAVRGLRRVIAPASKVIAAGIIKKATGIAVADLVESLKADEDASSDDSGKDVSDLVEAGLDKVFEDSLEEHQKRGQAIKDFRTSIELVISLIQREAGASLPVFVFVDEVDRCRPPYAIRLLEEIKHIFGVPNICYVVSTNLSQLRESVCAVYGAGFDGYGYLRRFFDRHYNLPDPNNENFCRVLFADETAIIRSKRLVTGLPASSSDLGADHAAGLLATAFDLDLRSMKQVFNIASAASAALPAGRPVFVIWLFFLAGLRHLRPELFTELLGDRLDALQFQALCKRAMKKNPEINYIQGDRFGQNVRRGRSTLIDVVGKYYAWSLSDIESLRSSAYADDELTYPQGNLIDVVDDMPRAGPKQAPSIAGYFDLVRFAGLSISSE